MKTIILIENQDMSEAATVTYNLTSNNANVDIAMIGICWREASGDTLNGTIDIYVANHNFDENDWCLIKTITVDSDDNELDKTIISIEIPVQLIRVDYTPNDIEAGELNVDLYGRDL